jgi:hypothetical protein
MKDKPRPGLFLGFDFDSQEIPKGTSSRSSVKDRLSRAITERLTIFWWNLVFWVTILLYLLVYGFSLMFFWHHRSRYIRAAYVFAKTHWTDRAQALAKRHRLASLGRG